MPSNPCAFEGAPTTKEKIGAINAKAHYLHGSILTFLITSLYITFSSLAISDATLFYGENLKLPILNIEVPFRSYAWLTPPALLMFHLYNLLQHWLLARHLRALTQKTQRGSWQPLEDDFTLSNTLAVLRVRGLPQRRFQRILVVFFHTFLYVAAPFVPQAVLMIRCVAFRDICLLRFQKGIFLATVLLTALLLVQLLDSQSSFSRALRRIGQTLRTFTGKVTTIALVTALCLAIYCITISVPKQECSDKIEPKIYGFLGFSTRLSLKGKVLTRRKNSNEKFSDGKNPAQEKNSEAFFTPYGRDFTCADFDGAHLRQIDFQGAKLAGASFVDAELESVDFLPEGIRRWELNRKDDHSSPLNCAERKVVDLTGARFEYAKLTDVKFNCATLDDAVFYDTEVDTSKFDGVRGERVDFRHANLTGTDFVGAKLSLAAFQEATFAGGSFAHAQLVGAQLRSTKLDCLDFSNVDLRAASFDLAALRGANFEGANLLGTSLRAVDFVGTYRPRLRLADLRGANIVGRCDPLSNDRADNLDDLYFLDLRGVTPARYGPFFAEIAEAKQNQTLSWPTCLAEEKGSLRQHLDETGLMDCLDFQARFPSAGQLGDLVRTLLLDEVDRERFFPGRSDPLPTVDTYYDALSEMLLREARKDSVFPKDPPSALANALAARALCSIPLGNEELKKRLKVAIEEGRLTHEVRPEHCPLLERDRP